MLKEKIEAELKGAMKNQTMDKLQTLRLLLAQIKNQEIDNKTKGKSGELTDEEIIAVLKREAKKRKEAMYLYIQGGREDLREKEEAELNIIKSYLPEEMGEMEIAKVLDAVIARAEKKEIGPIMGMAMKELGGRADGVVVQKILKEKLNG